MTNASLKLAIDSLPKAQRKEVIALIEVLKKKDKTNLTLKHREFGFAKGKIELSPDFDKPLNIT